jgi:sulfotransferase family protein
MSRDNWPIIVGGCHRSGTSLVRRILNAHSRIHCPPEVKFFRDFYGDFPDDPLAHGRFSATARVLLPEGELLAVIGRAFVELHERAAMRAGKTRWADKCPENVLYLDSWTRLLGDQWLFLHVVRNPLDTLASIQETPMPLVIPRDLTGRIEQYQRYTEAGLAFGRVHPGRYLRLVYDQLVGAPEETIDSMMRWADARFERRQLAFNSVAQGTGLEDPEIAGTSRVHSESVGRWVTILSREDAYAIWARTSTVWSEIDPDRRWVPAVGAVMG